jgi:outer membrane murein-binding lipoprotein Lpp
MKTIIFKTSLMVMMAALLTVCGCGKNADTTTPIDQIKAAAEKMDVAKLRDMAMTYKDAITAKAEEIKAEGLKLKDIPMAEMMGGKAKELNATIDELTKTVEALKERLNVYLEELKKKGGDLSGLQI